MAGASSVVRSVEELRALVGDRKPGVELKILDALDEFAIDYIARSPFLVLSTSDAEGRLDVSPKGDGPGFVLVEDDRTLVIPDRPGNKLVFGHLNILANPRVGLLFMIPGTNETLRVAGTAELDLYFAKDYEAREVFHFLGVKTLKELEQHRRDEIVEILTRPVIQTVDRIRKALACVHSAKDVIWCYRLAQARLTDLVDHVEPVAELVRDQEERRLPAGARRQR